MMTTIDVRRLMVRRDHDGAGYNGYQWGGPGAVQTLRDGEEFEESPAACGPGLYGLSCAPGHAREQTVDWSGSHVRVWLADEPPIICNDGKAKAPSGIVLGARGVREARVLLRAIEAVGGVVPPPYARDYFGWRVGCYDDGTEPPPAHVDEEIARWLRIASGHDVGRVAVYRAARRMLQGLTRIAEVLRARELGWCKADGVTVEWGSGHHVRSGVCREAAKVAQVLVEDAETVQAWGAWDLASLARRYGARGVYTLGQLGEWRRGERGAYRLMVLSRPLPSGMARSDGRTRTQGVGVVVRRGVGANTPITWDAVQPRHEVVWISGEDADRLRMRRGADVCRDVGRVDVGATIARAKAGVARAKVRAGKVRMGLEADVRRARDALASATARILSQVETQGIRLSWGRPGAYRVTHKATGYTRTYDAWRYDEVGSALEVITLAMTAGGAR